MKRIVLRGLAWYKQRISPSLPAGCRYLPTCSEYAYQAVEQHGVVRGGWMALKRLARCNPFRRGGVDPVPGTGAEGPAR